MQIKIHLEGRDLKYYKYLNRKVYNGHRTNKQKDTQGATITSKVMQDASGERRRVRMNLTFPLQLRCNAD